jgi:hypothetical protein
MADAKRSSGSVGQCSSSCVLPRMPSCLPVSRGTAGVGVWNVGVHLLLRTAGALRAGVLIATFHCDTHARCGGFADERRVVAGG